MERAVYDKEHLNSYWPIHPRWLSIAKGVRKSEVRPNKEGLFAPDRIRGFIAESSDIDNIHNPLSLFQVVPGDYEVEDPYNRIEDVPTQSKFISMILGDRKIIRIDTGKLYGNIGCCDEFRKCQGAKEKCFNLDSRIALLFHKDLENIDYFEDTELYITTLKNIVNDFSQTLTEDENHQKDPNLQVKEPENTNQRVYITYRCKYSGFDEYFFPVFHSGKVIAVIMHGQRPNSDLKNYPMFVPYLRDPVGGEPLRKSLENLKINIEFWWQDSMDKDRKDAIHERISTLELQINDSVNSISQQYVSHEFQEIEKDFREKIKKIDWNDAVVFDKFKGILNKTLKNIFYTFNRKGFIRIYSIKNSYNEEETTKEFELIGDSEFEILNKQYANLSFSDLPQTTHTIERDELRLLLNPSQQGLIKERHTFRLEMPFIHKMSYIIWKSYQVDNKKYVDQNKYYGDTLKLFYHVLLEPYIILKEVSFEELLEKSIRVSVHETAQVIPPIVHTLNSYFKKEKRQAENEFDFYKRFHKEFLKDIQEEGTFKELIKVIGDINDRIELLDGLYKRSTLVFKYADPSCNWEDFHRIIYSIRSLFEEKAFLNNRQKIDIYFDPVFSKYQILTDKNFISQILFNLVDNAIKYGMRGSKINIRVRLSESKKEFLRHGIISMVDSIQIVVENFGDGIETENLEKIFDLYYRSPKYINNQGLGIGLFLVKKLCHALGYVVECPKSKLVRKLNLPVYYYFMEQKGKMVISQLIEKNKLEVDVENSITLNADMENVVNIMKPPHTIDWDITVEEIDYLLEEECYCNQFVISIPIVNNIKRID